MQLETHATPAMKHVPTCLKDGHHSSQFWCTASCKRSVVYAAFCCCWVQQTAGLQGEHTVIAVLTGWTALIYGATQAFGGKKKDAPTGDLPSAGEVADTANDKATDVKEAVKDKASEVKAQVKETASDVKQEVQDKASQVKSQVQETVSDAKEKASDAMSNVQKSIDAAADDK